MKRFLLVLASAAALWSAACSSGGGTTVLPPPAGKYGLSSLNGTYAFVTNGEAFVNGAAVPSTLARTGSFVANGSGGIAGGVEDTVAVTVLPQGASTTVNTAITITGGGYSVGADGRGSVTLNLAAGVGGAPTITFGIVLTSTSSGLLIDETNTASQASTGSGNFFKQDTTAFTNPILPVAATYVFDFAGLDGAANGASLVGRFAAASGAISGGIQDVNDNFALTTAQVIPAGTLSQDPINPATLTSFGRGVAQIAGEAYIFYIVDATRIRFISISSGAMLTGDAVVQNNPPASLSNGFAFVVAGSSALGPLTRVGRFTANGTAVTNVLVDTNNAGSLVTTTGATQASVTLDAANPGRGTVTFLGSGLGTPFSFVFYLSSATSGVIQETTQSNGLAAAIADGSIGGQTGNPFSSSNISGTYAINWSGLSKQNAVFDEEDMLGQTTISSLALKGAADIFQFQNVNGPQTDNALTGVINIGGDGTGGTTTRNTMAVTLTKNGQATTVNSVVYFVSPQLAFFASTSTPTNRIVAGVLETQQ
jgi:hypothetical protein